MGLPARYLPCLPVPSASSELLLTTSSVCYVRMYRGRLCARTRYNQLLSNKEHCLHHSGNLAMIKTKPSMLYRRTAGEQVSAAFRQALGTVHFEYDAMSN